MGVGLMYVPLLGSAILNSRFPVRTGWATFQTSPHCDLADLSFYNVSGRGRRPDSTWIFTRALALVTKSQGVTGMDGLDGLGRYRDIAEYCLRMCIRLESFCHLGDRLEGIK